MHSIYQWRNQHSFDKSGGIQESNFKKIGPPYKEAMANITSSSVPVLAPKDETAIIGHVTRIEMSSWDFVGLTDNTMHALTTLLLKLRMAIKVS